MGGCCRKISREHIVTENLFIGGTIGVKGFPWCQKTPKLIRKEEFTSNILCERHNNMLSQVDQAGIDAFAAFRKLAELNDQRLKALAAKSPVLPFELTEYTVVGPMLERWFLKTLINMEAVGKQGMPIGPYQGKAGEPPQGLVEISFGHKQFQNGAGLYSLSREGQSIYLEERVLCSSWIRDSEQGSYIAAAEFLFYGYTFFLHLGEGTMPRVFQLGNCQVSLRHRPATIPSRLYGNLSQRINFIW